MTPFAYYSLITGRLIAVGAPTQQGEVCNPPLVGEGRLALDTSFTKQYATNGAATLDAVQAYITQQTGLSPFDAQGNSLDHYVFFQNGLVVDEIGNACLVAHAQNFADKRAQWPQAQMLAHPSATVGWSVLPDRLGGFSLGAPPPTPEELANQQTKAARNAQVATLGS